MEEGKSMQEFRECQRGSGREREEETNEAMTTTKSKVNATRPLADYVCVCVRVC